jgi:hypothetical protein
MREVFIGTERLVSGSLTRSQLRWNYASIFPGVYVPRAAGNDLRSRIAGAWLWSGRDGIIAGRAAASLHGAEWIDADTPIELIAGRDRSPRGIVIRNERIDADEVVEIDGMLVTSPARTALDLGRHLHRDEAVRHLDALARVSRIGPADALSLVSRHRRARGLRRAEIALDLMDGGSQPPMETPATTLVHRCGLSPPHHADPRHRRLRERVPGHGLGGTHGQRRLRRRTTSQQSHALRPRHRPQRTRQMSGVDRRTRRCRTLEAIRHHADG